MSGRLGSVCTGGRISGRGAGSGMRVQGIDRRSFVRIAALSAIKALRPLDLNVAHVQAALVKPS